MSQVNPLVSWGRDQTIAPSRRFVAVAALSPNAGEFNSVPCLPYDKVFSGVWILL